MSLSTRVASALTRVGAEIKTVRTEIAAVNTKAKRWEQEILVMPGVRELGYGPAELGIYVPFNITLFGIRYAFETPTTTGTTTAELWLNRDYNFNAAGAQMSIAALNTGQTITSLGGGGGISIDAGSRLSCKVTGIGSGTIGSGLYMALWGEYR